MRIGTFARLAGPRVPQCGFLAPEQASSSASPKESVRMRRAPGTIRGSAVIMPSTSVQIWTSSAPRAAPTMAAEKSDPSLPRVVVTPVPGGAHVAADHRHPARLAGGGGTPRASAARSPRRSAWRG